MEFETTITVDFARPFDGKIIKQGTPISIKCLAADFFLVRSREAGRLGEFIGHVRSETLRKIMPEKDYFCMLMVSL